MKEYRLSEPSEEVKKEIISRYLALRMSGERVSGREFINTNGKCYESDRVFVFKYGGRLFKFNKETHNIIRCRDGYVIRWGDCG